MSTNKMLIDATHPEETRVVVLRENRVEEFDYESAARKLLRGSIYLAKITRVEPSLQAAFIDYGGNRHGFLAFAEIHPDYYQIPHADKLALLEQESQDQASYDDDLDQSDDVADVATDASPEPIEATAAEQIDTADGETSETSAEPAATEENGPALSAGSVADDTNDDQSPAPAEHDFEAHAIDVTDLLPDANDDDGTAAASTAPSASLDVVPSSDDVISAEIAQSGDQEDASEANTSDDATPQNEAHVHITADPIDQGNHDEDDDSASDEDDAVESLNDIDDDDDAIEAIAGEDDADNDDDDEGNSAETPARRTRQSRPRRRARHYKIQEVIKRRQIVLIQVVKEERGNKGAALTTYLSLAGRYTVLMPNTARGGGISRKITNVQDRKRLKAIAQELEVPEGMGLIIRTAGAARTKQEIKRDFEYLLRLWESVRSLTLESTAPSLVYEEGNLIKRSIRDLYTKEIDEVVVAGDHAHKEAKGFMRMLMPSHAKNVTKHEDSQSLFAKYRIEQQLNAMFSPNVQLKSGGYLVINQTEALVAIDVNSGKSTREFSIEETALNTNLEAAEELSRQLKLRDLAGLIVVDFIDMEEKRNNRAVERRLKDSLRADRARIQVGRISHFGLLEMSRQRLRTGVLEGSTTPCEHCQGSGIIRSIESVSLAVLRGLEDTLVAGKITSCVANCSADVALYLLNQKRAFIQELEERYGVVIHVQSSSKQQGANFLIEPLQDVVQERPRAIPRDVVNIDAGFSSNRVADNDDGADEATTAETKPRRRRRRRGRRDETQSNGVSRDTTDDIELADTQATDEAATSDAASGDTDEGGDGDRPRRSRRRGRRGGRRHREQRASTDGDTEQQNSDSNAEANEGGSEPEPQDMDQVTTAAIQESPTIDASMADGSTSTAQPQQLETTEQPAAPAEPIAEPMTSLEPAAASIIEDAPKFTTGSENAAADTSSEVESQVEASAAELSSTSGEQPVSGQNGAHAAPQEEAVSQIDTPDRSARSQPVASEPVIQRVVVGPDGQNGGIPEAPPADATDSTAVAPDAPKPPSRRGWWQRQFGG